MPFEFFTEPVDESGAVRGQVCLATGDGNQPLIAYTTDSGAVMLAERVDGEWLLSSVPGGAATHDAYRVSLALDGGGEPHIAFVNADSDHLVYGVRRATWQFEDVPTKAGLFPGPVRFPALRLYRGFFEDPAHDGEAFQWAPHLCYQAGLSLWHASKQRRRATPQNPPTWKKNVVPVEEADGTEKGWFATLDFDHEDNLRIAAFDDLPGGNRRRLRLSTLLRDFEDGPDETETIEAVGGDIVGEYPAIAHSITGEAIVTYYERKERAIKVFMFGNGPGLPALGTVASDLDGVNVQPSPAISFNNGFCVAYGSGGKLRLATRVGSAGLAIQDVADGGDWASLDIDIDGNAHIAHVAEGRLMYAFASRSEG
ncbi:hypothetical protein ACFQY4_20020 [Catellatospora bangladeshensis]|uniref:Uncharacterized protein n=1 Tax=Catellatospora bangladeshensis TaxID=310355 RepID=A0A8J3NN44_9ACTN|nr:hypothetical protein [Catellatospora bangladeshensis]GIF85916.1 hypothetical protein Cba03nite_72650 [Catellatospora bangladeshensis]